MEQQKIVLVTNSKTIGMREIKFRAWDKRSNQMVDDYAVNSLSNGGIYVASFHSKSSVFMGDFELMQYTGIKDDDGNALYEGDIVNYVTGNPKRYVNCVIRFGEYDTYTKLVTLDPDHNSDDGDVEHHCGFYLEDQNNKIPLMSLWIKKIGNIYENPDLLTQKQ